MYTPSEFDSRARIAFVSSKSTQDEQSAVLPLTKSFKQAGYIVLPPKSDLPADVVLVDLRKKLLSAAQLKRLVFVCRKRSVEATLLFLVGPEMTPDQRQPLHLCGDVLAIADGQKNARAIVERIRMIMRLKNMSEESGERLKTLSNMPRIGDIPPLSAERTPPRVLIAGAPGHTALAVTSAVASLKGTTHGVLSAGQAFHALTNSQFDAAVFLPEDVNDPLMGLARMMRRHHTLANVPALMIADDVQRLSDISDLGIDTGMLADHAKDDLASLLRTSIRRARMIRAMQKFLRGAKGASITDSASSAYSNSFLTLHGARLCARADALKKPLSMLAIKLDQINTADGSNSSTELPLTFISDLIGRVTRAEDLVARLTKDIFVLALPNIPANDGQRIAGRIEGVFGHTLYKNDIHVPASLRMRSAVVSREHGASIEETVAAALNALKTQDSAELKASRS